MKSRILTAIDIGTNSIKLLVGEKEKNRETIALLAMEEFPHSNLKRGEVYNPGNIAKALSFLIERVEKTKGLKIKKAIVNVNGPHLFPLRSQGLVSVSRADQKISEEDINRVLMASQAVNLPSNKEIMEVIPLDFIVDNEPGVREPVGLCGIRLEAKVLLVCVFSPVLENLERAVAEAGIEIEEIVPSPLAASAAVLSREEKELGAAVMDIGAGTTSISIFSEGNLEDFAVIPLGSANITNDIAVGLRIEIAAAEEIKKQFALSKNSPKEKAKKRRIVKKEPDKRNFFAEGSFSRAEVKNILKSRISEIFAESAKVIKKNSKDFALPAGVILTGGGACLPGIVDFAKDKFELPAYLSGPKNIAGLEDPSFSACAGLLLSGFEEKREIKVAGEAGLGGKIKKIFKIFLP